MNGWMHCSTPSQQERGRRFHPLQLLKAVSGIFESNKQHPFGSPLGFISAMESLAKRIGFGWSWGTKSSMILGFLPIKMFLTGNLWVTEIPQICPASLQGGAPKTTCNWGEKKTPISSVWYFTPVTHLLSAIYRGRVITPLITGSGESPTDFTRHPFHGQVWWCKTIWRNLVDVSFLKTCSNFCFKANPTKKDEITFFSGSTLLFWIAAEEIFFVAEKMSQKSTDPTVRCAATWWPSSNSEQTCTKKVMFDDFVMHDFVDDVLHHTFMNCAASILSMIFCWCFAVSDNKLYSCTRAQFLF